MTTSATNYRIAFTAAGVVELEECPPPTPGAGELLIRTRATLISPGTERAFFLGMPNTPQQYPHYPGYSNIGEVVAVGAGIEGWAPGMRVANIAGHAAFVVMGAEKCVPVPEGLPDDMAVFFNLAAIAMQGVRKARVELGESVVVIGAGLIGLLALQLARLNGGLPVISVDTDQRRLAFAQKVEADAVATVDDSLANQIAQSLDGDSPVVVIEATGHPEAILTAFALARPGGRVILLGSTRGETEQVNFYRDVHKKGLTVIGAHNSARPAVESYPGWWIAQDDQRVALKLLALGRLNVRSLITHQSGWRDAPAAYERLKRWDGSTLGMVLKWDE